MIAGERVSQIMGAKVSPKSARVIADCRTVWHRADKVSERIKFLPHITVQTKEFALNHTEIHASSRTNLRLLFQISRARFLTAYHGNDCLVGIYHGNK